jgi:hypothetical protein
MALKLFDRIATLLKADAHGVVESLEERTLLLKQYLREAELEVNRKRARLEAVREEEKTAPRAAIRREEESRALDEDVRSRSRRQGRSRPLRISVSAPTGRGEGDRARIAERVDEAQRLGERVELQQAQLDALRTRVRAELAREAPSRTRHRGSRRRSPTRSRARADAAPRAVGERHDAHRLVRTKRRFRGAIAALGWIPWLLVAAPLLGGPAARTLYLVAVTALYAVGLASHARRRASAILVGGLAGGVLACVAPGMPELCVGLAIVLGTVRCGFVPSRQSDPRRRDRRHAAASADCCSRASSPAGRCRASRWRSGASCSCRAACFLVGGIEARGRRLVAATPSRRRSHARPRCSSVRSPENRGSSAPSVIFDIATSHGPGNRHSN